MKKEKEALFAKKEEETLFDYLIKWIVELSKQYDNEAFRDAYQDDQTAEEELGVLLKEEEGRDDLILFLDEVLSSDKEELYPLATELKGKLFEYGNPDLSEQKSIDEQASKEESKPNEEFPEKDTEENQEEAFAKEEQAVSLPRAKVTEKDLAMSLYTYMKRHGVEADYSKIKESLQDKDKVKQFASYLMDEYLDSKKRTEKSDIILICKYMDACREVAGIELVQQVEPSQKKKEGKDAFEKGMDKLDKESGELYRKLSEKEYLYDFSSKDGTSSVVQIDGMEIDYGAEYENHPFVLMKHICDKIGELYESPYEKKEDIVQTTETLLMTKEGREKLLTMLNDKFFALQENRELGLSDFHEADHSLTLISSIMESVIKLDAPEIASKDELDNQKQQAKERSQQKQKSKNTGTRKRASAKKQNEDKPKYSAYYFDRQPNAQSTQKATLYGNSLEELFDKTEKLNEDRPIKINNIYVSELDSRTNQYKNDTKKYNVETRKEASFDMKGKSSARNSNKGTYKNKQNSQKKPAKTKNQSRKKKENERG